MCATRAQTVRAYSSVALFRWDFSPMIVGRPRIGACARSPLRSTDLWRLSSRKSADTGSPTYDENIIYVHAGCDRIPIKRGACRQADATGGRRGHLAWARREKRCGRLIDRGSLRFVATTTVEKRFVSFRSVVSRFCSGRRVPFRANACGPTAVGVYYLSGPDSWTTCSRLLLK